MVQRMIDEGEIDYCELLIDNFLHVPPDELIDAFRCPVTFRVRGCFFLKETEKHSKKSERHSFAQGSHKSDLCFRSSAALYA